MCMYHRTVYIYVLCIIRLHLLPHIASPRRIHMLGSDIVYRYMETGEVYMCMYHRTVYIYILCIACLHPLPHIALPRRIHILGSDNVYRYMETGDVYMWERIRPLCQIGFGPVRNYLAR